MTAIQIVHLDPWLKQPADDRAIDNATFVGRYGVDIGIDTIAEAAFLRRSPRGRWELWTVAAFSDTDMDEILRRVTACDPSWRALTLSRGLAIAGAGEASERDAGKFLFYRLQRATVDYSSPSAPFVGGLLSAETLSQVVDEIAAERRRNRQAALAIARDNAVAIIEAARDLKLDPRPAGHHADAWMANCPGGKSHWIMISASANEFGCGYCRRKGGPAELRQFCEAVRDARSSKSHEVGARQGATCVRFDRALDKLRPS